MGFKYLIFNLAQERLSIAVAAIASAQAALDWTLEYVKERNAFGKPIGSFQNSRFKLAEMKTEIDIGTVYHRPLHHGPERRQAVGRGRRRRRSGGRPRCAAA